MLWRKIISAVLERDHAVGYLLLVLLGQGTLLLSTLITVLKAAQVRHDVSTHMYTGTHA